MFMVNSGLQLAESKLWAGPDLGTIMLLSVSSLKPKNASTS